VEFGECEFSTWYERFEHTGNCEIKSVLASFQNNITVSIIVAKIVYMRMFLFWKLRYHCITFSLATWMNWLMS